MSARAQELSPREFGRWIWRQLTSMRTALLLLLLLAVAAVPGSFIPQRGVDIRAVDAWFARNPDIAPILDKFGLFDVFSSAWFSAIYVLLMISLVGCILPRIGVYWRALKRRPPRTPRNLSRFDAYGSFETTAPASLVADVAQNLLRRYRTDVDAPADGTIEVRAEKGFLREAGNLVFHISIVIVLVGVAIGTLWGYRGAVIIVEGDGFSNTLSAYDEFGAGARFNPDDLSPFTLRLDQVEARFHVTGPQRGSPEMFRASGEVVPDPTSAAEPFAIEVNHPLKLKGGGVFLVGQGYAPVFRVTAPDGQVVFDGPVPFLPNDATYLSSGVLKVPDFPGTQLGFQGFFLPTAWSPSADEPSSSIFPAPLNPRIGMTMWTGDLGIDEGAPQSVYILNTSRMEQVKDGDDNFRVDLAPGEKLQLPEGGTLEFVEVRKFARFQIGHTPVIWLPLLGVSLAIFGLMFSLAVRPRRTWIRATGNDGGTVVEVAALDRQPRDDLPTDVKEFLVEFREAVEERERNAK